ncbi:hypothetical protein [Clostridium sp. FS41]|uniref:hypothetical protein n=1 Tax=Clostridia TaxID=186801 RepID=UPI0005D35DF1|nr:hypothetical protein [Clostridium sp. FS41]
MKRKRGSYYTLRYFICIILEKLAASVFRLEYWVKNGRFPKRASKSQIEEIRGILKELDNIKDNK